MRSEKSKNANGEGSRVRKIKRGGKTYYLAQFTALWDPVAKKQTQVSATATTREEAIRRITEKKDTWFKRNKQPSAQGTINELLDRWLAFKESDVRPRTIAAARRHADLYIRPHLGRMALRKLTPTEVQEWVSAREPAKRKKEEGRGSKGRRVERLSPTTMKHALRILKGALTWGVTMKIADYNPAREISGPRAEHELKGRKKAPPKYLDPEQVATLLAEARGQRMESYLATTFLLGLRPSECLGLAWYDPADPDRGGVELVEDKAGKVVACNFWLRSSLLEHPETGAFSLDGLKTEKSQRDIENVTEERIVDAFRRRRSQQAQDRLRAGELWQETIPELVFTDGLGKPVDLGGARRALDRVTKKAKLPRWVTPYTGRHSAATNSIAAGVPVHEVSRVLGHSGIDITLRVYGHAVPKVVTRTANAMASVGKEPR